MIFSLFTSCNLFGSIHYIGKLVEVRRDQFRFRVIRGCSKIKISYTVALAAGR